jgi:phenylacetate-CoA ligase
MASAVKKLFGDSKYFGIFREVIQHSGNYLKTRKLLRKIDFMSEEDIRTYQYHRLKKIITTAYENIPFYHFKAAGFKPEHFRQNEDITRVPFLTKDMIREHYKRMVRKNVPSRCLKLVTTGGTTGTPLKFFLDRRASTPKEFAYIQYIWKRFGFHFRDRCVVLRGDIFEEPGDRISYWKKNYPMNWLAMSALRLNEGLFQPYLEQIRKFKPKFIIAYPSTAYILANYIRTHSLPAIESLQAVICSSETLYGWQRKYISRTLNVQVYAYYGLTEKCCLASQFDETDSYEFLPTYGFVEFINNSGQWCSTDGEMGEIVATGLNSITTPLIRYKTQDMCIYSDASFIHKGWPSVRNISGRISEFLVDKSGSLVTFTCADEIFWPVLQKMNAYQYVQTEPGKLQIKLDLKQPLTSSELKDFKDTLVEYYPRFEIEISEKEKIHKTKSGKFRFLIQNIPIYFNADA